MIAMEKFFNFLDRRVAGPMSMISEQRHIRAIRDGVISAIPFIIAGSLI
ncbi:PTS sugar transporter subunit IIC, partial [Staphylococcus simulans]